MLGLFAHLDVGTGDFRAECRIAQPVSRVCRWARLR